MITRLANSFHRSRWLWIGAPAAIALAVFGIVLLKREGPPSSQGALFAPIAQNSDYVDPAECVRCHRDIAATYRKTGMGRSFAKASTANVVEDFARRNSLDHRLSGMHYEMIERNGEFFERRSERGFDGKETNVMEERIDYVIGSDILEHGKREKNGQKPSPKRKITKGR